MFGISRITRSISLFTILGFLIALSMLGGTTSASTDPSDGNVQGSVPSEQMVPGNPILPSRVVGTSPRSSLAYQPGTSGKISGYILQPGDTLGIQGFFSVPVHLESSKASCPAYDTTTGVGGYFEFSISEQDAFNECYKEATISVVTPDFATEFSVSYSYEANYLDPIHQEVHIITYVYLNRFRWNGQNQFFTLIPPHQLPTTSGYVDSAQRPLVLVHGFTGKPPYWEGIRPRLLDKGYQVWEVYYPNVESIVDGAAVVRDAVDTILNIGEYNFDDVDIIAHSMGGPVTRAYIQRLPRSAADPTPPAARVHRILQLSPANNGSIGVYSVLHNQIGACQWLVGAVRGFNPDWPALRDLALGSSLMQRLEETVTSRDYISEFGLDNFLQTDRSYKPHHRNVPQTLFSGCLPVLLPFVLAGR